MTIQPCELLCDYERQQDRTTHHGTRHDEPVLANVAQDLLRQASRTGSDWRPHLHTCDSLLARVTGWFPRQCYGSANACNPFDNCTTTYCRP